MIKNLKKKAFTLVELLVVIAILAILATAGIVGYTSFTKKAQVSNDNSLVAELNNYISVATVDNDFNTVSEVRDELVPSGIDLSNLTPSAKNHGYSYAFNLKEEKFVLLDGTSLADGYSLAADTKTWDVFVLVATNAKANEFMQAGYSVYLQNGFDAAEVNASKGVDVGENNGITAINYTNTAAAQDVVIRTNSFDTALTINTKGSVKHFGNVGTIDIQEVAMASFHEHGNARVVKLAKGNLEVAQGATVTLVKVTATAADTAKVKVDGEVTTYVATDTSVVPMSGNNQPEAVEVENSENLDSAVAIINNEAVTEFADNYTFSSGTMILLEDTNKEITVTGGTIVGNFTKLKAKISGSGTIVFKNIYTTSIKLALVASKYTFSGSLTFDGGVLETGNPTGTADSDAAFYAQAGEGTYAFKNMTIAANITKGIKIVTAKSVTVENCEFDASRLTKMQSGVESDIRSLSLIDIQNMNTTNKMTVKINGCTFIDAPQGTEKNGVKDADTSAAIKLKAETTSINNEGKGFEKVDITNNKFINCYRDVGIGTVLYEAAVNGKKLADMQLNAIDSKFNISGNTTTTTAAVVASRGYQTYNGATTEAENVGAIIGGCAVWATAKSSHNPAA